MKPYLFASLAALVAGWLAFPAKTGAIKPHREVAEAADLSILTSATRLVLVVADDFDGPDATIELYTRKSGSDGWTSASDPVDAVIGQEGLAWWPSFASFGAKGEPIKEEPDRRTPAGIFPLGRSFGFEAAGASRFDIALAEGKHFCVDDVTSPLYNRIVSEDEAGEETTGERMWQLSDYRRGLLIDYPTDLKRHPASCVFVHIWPGDGSGTAGCIGLPIEDVEALQEFARDRPTAIAIVSKETRERFRGFLPQPADEKSLETTPETVSGRRDGPGVTLKNL